MKNTGHNQTNQDQHSEVAVPGDSAHRRRILKTLRKKHFCTVATTSPAGRPHSAGVIYQWADNSLWVHTMNTSRKARSIDANGRAAVTVPFRKLPAGPPFTIHFQARAAVVAMDAPEVQGLLANGELQKISGHGALDEPDGCFLRLQPIGTVHSYGPGANLVGLIKDPLHNGFAQLPAAALLTAGKADDRASENIKRAVA